MPSKWAVRSTIYVDICMATPGLLPRPKMEPIDIAAHSQASSAEAGAPGFDSDNLSESAGHPVLVEAIGQLELSAQANDPALQPLGGFALRSSPSTSSNSRPRVGTAGNKSNTRQPKSRSSPWEEHPVKEVVLVASLERKAKDDEARQRKEGASALSASAQHVRQAGLGQARMSDQREVGGVPLVDNYAPLAGYSTESSKGSAKKVSHVRGGSKGQQGSMRSKQARSPAARSVASSQGPPGKGPAHPEPQDGVIHSHAHRTVDGGRKGVRPEPIPVTKSPQQTESPPASPRGASRVPPHVLSASPLPPRDPPRAQLRPRQASTSSNRPIEGSLPQTQKMTMTQTQAKKQTQAKATANKAGLGAGPHRNSFGAAAQDAEDPREVTAKRDMVVQWLDDTSRHYGIPPEESHVRQSAQKGNASAREWHLYEQYPSSILTPTSATPNPNSPSHPTTTRASRAPESPVPSFGGHRSPRAKLSKLLSPKASRSPREGSHRSVPKSPRVLRKKVIETVQYVPQDADEEDTGASGSRAGVYMRDSAQSAYGVSSPSQGGYGEHVPTAQGVGHSGGRSGHASQRVAAQQVAMGQPASLADVMPGYAKQQQARVQMSNGPSSPGLATSYVSHAEVDQQLQVQVQDVLSPRHLSSQASRKRSPVGVQATIARWPVRSPSPPNDSSDQGAPHTARAQQLSVNEEGSAPIRSVVSPTRPISPWALMAQADELERQSRQAGLVPPKTSSKFNAAGAPVPAPARIRTRTTSPWTHHNGTETEETRGGHKAQPADSSALSHTNTPKRRALKRIFQRGGKGDKQGAAGKGFINKGSGDVPVPPFLLTSEEVELQRQSNGVVTGGRDREALMHGRLASKGGSGDYGGSLLQTKPTDAASGPYSHSPDGGTTPRSEVSGQKSHRGVLQRIRNRLPGSRQRRQSMPYNAYPRGVPGAVQHGGPKLRRESLLSSHSALMSEQFMSPEVENAIEDGLMGYRRLMNEDPGAYQGPPELAKARQRGEALLQKLDWGDSGEVDVEEATAWLGEYRRRLKVLGVFMEDALGRRDLQTRYEKVPSLASAGSQVLNDASQYPRADGSHRGDTYPPSDAPRAASFTDGGIPTMQPIGPSHSVPTTFPVQAGMASRPSQEGSLQSSPGRGSMDVERASGTRPPSSAIAARQAAFTREPASRSVSSGRGGSLAVPIGTGGAGGGLATRGKLPTHQQGSFEFEVAGHASNGHRTNGRGQPVPGAVAVPVKILRGDSVGSEGGDSSALSRQSSGGAVSPSGGPKPAKVGSRPRSRPGYSRHASRQSSRALTPVRELAWLEGNPDAVRRVSINARLRPMDTRKELVPHAAHGSERSATPGVPNNDTPDRVMDAAQALPAKPSKSGARLDRSHGKQSGHGERKSGGGQMALSSDQYKVSTTKASTAHADGQLLTPASSGQSDVDKSSSRPDKKPASVSMEFSAPTRDSFARSAPSSRSSPWYDGVHESSQESAGRGEHAQKATKRLGYGGARVPPDVPLVKVHLTVGTAEPRLYIYHLVG